MEWFREFGQAWAGLNAAEMVVAIAICILGVAVWVLGWLYSGSRQEEGRLRERNRQLEEIIRFRKDDDEAMPK